MNFKPISYIYRKTGKRMIEKVPGEKYLEFLYYNPFGKLGLETVVKKKLLTWYYGKQMDKPSSTSKIYSLIESAGINMEESKKKVTEFKTFNEFFIRELKDGARVIDKTPGVLTSPADGKIFVYNHIDTMKNFFVKGDEFTLKDFLRDETLVEKYRDGIFMIVRLAPVDYHRFHFPADGIISKSTLIPGDYYSVSTHAIRKNLRIYCENKREYSILETEKFGDIFMCEVGATMVGGIKQTYKEGSHVKKGEEKGYFYFGGSTMIMMFEKGRVKIDEDLIKNSLDGIETKVYMGERIGVVE